MIIKDSQMKFTFLRVNWEDDVTDKEYNNSLALNIKNFLWIRNRYYRIPFF